ncbi:hypothetical protein EJB05_04806, partial [Eragrostis curvula]
MEGDPTGLPLSEDVLADVLRRLPPRSLAASRCVCKAWLAVIDGRRLLRADLLPHSVRGIFLTYHDLDFPAFLSSPSTQPVMMFNKLDLYRLRPEPYYLYSFTTVLDHRNGLLLYQDRRGMHVANPATQRRAQLPTPPRFGETHLLPEGLLLFDPTESPHYEVLIVPVDWLTEETEEEMQHETMDRSKEWPASTWVLCVFSSRTGQWEERSFVREGEAVRTAYDEYIDPLWQASSAYCRGALFVQCNGGSDVLRISLSNDKYQVIELSADIGEAKDRKPYLGRSKHGVCCALFDSWFSCKFRVWILDESCGKTGWVLKHHVDIEHNVSRVMSSCIQIEGPWILEDANVHEAYGANVNNNALVKSEFEWESENDNIVDGEHEVCQSFRRHFTFLGFHPYKDVVFLDISMDRAVACHLNTCKIQDLGKVCPGYYGGPVASLISPFLYTPCLMEEFPESKWETHIED